MVDIIPPRRDEFLTENGVPTLRFSEYLENLAGSVNTVTTEVELSDGFASEVNIQNALIARLTSRVDDLEVSNDTDVLNSKIANVGAKVTRLIDELIAEVRLLRDVELENKALSVQQAIRAEMELLNARVEEAFETDINGDDL